MMTTDEDVLSRNPSYEHSLDQAAAANKPAEKLTSLMLAKEDRWIASLDLPEFARELKELGKELQAMEGKADVEQLHKIVRWSRTCTAFLACFPFLASWACQLGHVCYVTVCFLSL
jgi:hypothetical protein